MWFNHPSAVPAELPGSLPAQLRAWKRQRDAALQARELNRSFRKRIELTPTGRVKVKLPPAPSPDLCAASPREALEASEELHQLLADPSRSSNSHAAHNELWRLYLASSYLVPASAVRAASKEAADILSHPPVRKFLLDTPGDPSSTASLQDDGLASLPGDEATGARIRVSALPPDTLMRLLVHLAPKQTPRMEPGSFEMYPVVKRYARRAVALIAQERAQRSVGSSLAAALVPGFTPWSGDLASPSIQPLLTVLEWALAQTQAEVVDGVLAVLAQVPRGEQATEFREAIRLTLCLLVRRAALAAVHLSARQDQRSQPRRGFVWNPSHWNRLETVCSGCGERALSLLSSHGLPVDVDTASAAVHLFARTSRLDRVFSLLKEHWDIDLLNPDLPPRQGEGVRPPFPLSTELFNTIIFALGQQLPASEMIAAFNTLTEPLKVHLLPDLNRTAPETELDFTGSSAEAEESSMDGASAKLPVRPGRVAVAPNLNSYEILLYHLVNPIKGLRYQGRENFWSELLPRARVRLTFEAEQKRRSRGSYALLAQAVLDQALDQAVRQASEQRKRVLTVLAVEQRPVALREAGIAKEDLVAYLPQASEGLVPTRHLLKWVLHLCRDRGRNSLIKYMLAYLHRWEDFLMAERAFMHEAAQHTTQPDLHGHLATLEDAYAAPLNLVGEVTSDLERKKYALHHKKYNKAFRERGNLDMPYETQLETSGPGETGEAQAPQTVNFVDVSDVAAAGTQSSFAQRERKLRGKERRAAERELIEARRKEQQELWERGG